MTAPARHNHVFHGLKKPEIAYLPTACAEALPFPPPTVLSCYRPYMGRQSWRFEGQTFESPHILVYDRVRITRPTRPAIPDRARLAPRLSGISFVLPFSSWPGLTRPSSSLLEQSPDRARLAPRLSRDGIEASFAYFNS